MSRKKRDTPVSPIAPTEPAFSAVKDPASSGEHAAVREYREQLEKLDELADQIARGEVPASPVPDEGPETVRPEHLDASRARQEWVLVVEDDEDIREVLAEILREAGYAVRVAADGLEALEKATNTIKPDLIILDLGLPRLSGKAVAAALDADDVLIPRLIISAAGNVQRLLALHPELEGEFVFPKPLQLDAFLEKVAQRIAEYRSRPRLPF